MVNAEDITEGDITAAIATASTGKIVKGIIVNLAAETAYKVTAPIAAAGNVIINGAANATIDASGCVVTTGEGESATTSAAPFIQMSATPGVAANEAGGYPIDGITIKDVTITGVKAQLIYANKVKYLFGKILVENSVIGIDGTNKKTIFDFNGGGLPEEIVVNKSTLWANPSNAVNGGLYSTQSGSKMADVGATKNEITITNSTLYNIANGKPVSTLRQNSAEGQKYTVKNNIIVDCGAEKQFLKGLNARQAGKDENWDVDGNIFNWGGANVVEDNVGATAGNVKNSIAGVITFTDAAAGTFDGTFATTSDITSVTAGDPRWTITVEKLDMTTLDATIATAEGLLEGKDATVADSPEKTLSDAIAAAKAAKAAAKSQTEVDAANTALETAIGIYKTATGINGITVDGVSGDIFSDGKPVYNLSGQRVFKGYKGIVIKNGRKVVIK